MTNAMPEQDEGNADSAETRSLSKLVKEETIKFLSETSLHGVQNVTRNERRRFGRTVWLLAVLSMASWLVYTLTYQFTNYFSYPHVTTTMASQAKSYQLPTVTVCLKDPLDRGHLSSLPHSSILERYFDTSLKPLNWSDPLVQSVMSNVTMQQVMKVASFSTEEVLGKESIIFSAFTDVIVRVSVLDALWGRGPSRCYTANTTASGKQMLKMTDSLSLYFRVPQATVIPFEDVGGMKVYVHQPWQQPLMMKYTEVAFGTAVSLKLTTTKVNGVKQGCVLAPVMFNLFFTCVLSHAVRDIEDGVYIRPLKRFKDCIKANVVHTGIALKQLEECAQDRNGWRALTREVTETFENNRRDSITEARARRKAAAVAPKPPGQFPCPHCGRLCRFCLGLHSHLRVHPCT
ncbi:hypothetical protein ACOMHN_041719 [Nucella lapillus]